MGIGFIKGVKRDGGVKGGNPQVGQRKKKWQDEIGAGSDA